MTGKENDVADYEMTQAELDELIAASQPVRYMVFGGMEPIGPREKAEEVWKKLGQRMGFKWATARPNGKGDRFFSAEPDENLAPTGQCDCGALISDRREQCKRCEDEQSVRDAGR